MGSLKIQTDLYVDESRYVLSSNKLNSFLYLHPSAMASFSATNGSWALVHTGRGCIIVKLCSSEKVNAQCAVFHSSVYKHYQSSTISRISLNVSTEAAKDVYLYPEKFVDFMNFPEFQVYIEKVLRHVYVRKGLIVNINYLGYNCYLTIKHITVETSSSTRINDKELQSTPKIDFENIDAVQTSTPISSHKTRSFKQLCEEKFYFLHSLSKIIVKQSEPKTCISFKDIVALNEVILFIKSSISSILQSDNSLLNVFPRGIILTGPSGCGKSMISKALKSEGSVPVFIVECQNMKSSKDNASCEKIYEEAVSCIASIIFLDDFDVFFAADNQLLRDEEILTSIKSLIFKSLNYASNILLIASARNKNLIPSFLRKTGFFEKELVMNISSFDRKQIFLKILRDHKCVLDETEIDEIIKDTSGFTGGQLQHLCNKAKDIFLQNPKSHAQDYTFTFKELKMSLQQIKSNVSFKFEIPNVKWNDIGGMKEVKDALTEMISWPLRLSSQFKRFRITASRGILMYGPPGCCKTMIAKALVTEGNLNFIPVKASELFNKYVGESEKTVSDLFKRARASVPCVLFFDEIDSLTSSRNSTSGSSNVNERIVTQLLTEIDGIEPLAGVCILAATNRPDIIDPSFLRPGRFDHMIYVPLPDSDTRCEIFNLRLREMPTSENLDVPYLVNATEGYSGAELSEICQLAAKYAIREDAVSLSSKHLTKALEEVRPKTSAEMKQFFIKYRKQRTSYA